jgi:preprotein translocase subunit SecE
LVSGAMNGMMQFLNEVKLELSKVVWPKFNEWVGSTIVVLVIVVAFAVYLGLVDTVIFKLMKRVLQIYSNN